MQTISRKLAPGAALAALIIFTAAPALADMTRLPIPAPPQINASSYAVLDATSGRLLAAMEPDKRVPPASLTKLMTAYVVFHALRAGHISLDDQAPVSRNAYRTEGSRMFIEVNDKVRVEDLIRGMIIQSGNDASVALAEYIAGSEAVFAELMNSYAQELGMLSSHFENSTGLPGEMHYSTARDMATLATAIVTEFPDYYRWYSEREFSYNDITQQNRNRLLWQDSTVDGMKTGYTEAAGYCLVSSASRDGMRIVSAVMGTPSTRARLDASQALLNYGFRFFETHRLYAAGDRIDTARVWKGEAEFADLGVDHDVYVTIPRGAYDRLQPTVTLARTLYAPVDRGADVGRLKVMLDGEVVHSAPLKTLDSVPEGGFFSRVADEVRLWFE